MFYHASCRIAVVVSWFVLGPSWSGFVATIRGDEPLDPVRLDLVRVSAERHDATIDFRCTAFLLNETSAALHVKSSFHSAFDGLQLVVLNQKGKRLARQSYTHHQSPFSADGREFTVAPGKNRGTLVFPIAGLPREIESVWVLLIGTLPESGQAGILCSDMIEVDLDARPARAVKKRDSKVANESDLVGLPAARALDHFEVGIEDLELVDEPPGKLQGVTFTHDRGGKTRRVTIWLNYTARLFAAERDWTIDAIRNATVREIATEE
jgi:hypothetical protein